MSETTQILSLAVKKIMKPLVRLLLQHGVSFNAFSELIKSLYIEIAENEFALAEKKQTISRISTLTGLTRKEVKKAQNNIEIDLGKLTQQYNRAARVISGWVRDADFHTKKGRPAILSIEDSELSFKSLVKRYSGDIPPKAIADELLRVGAIKNVSGNKFKLIEHAYIPQKNIDEKIRILGTDVNYLIETIYHNIYKNNETPFFQRKVSYNAIPENLLNELRKKIHMIAQSTIEDMDKLMITYDCDNNETLDKKSNSFAGVGIYYFEELNNE